MKNIPSVQINKRPKRQHEKPFSMKANRLAFMLKLANRYNTTLTALMAKAIWLDKHWKQV